MDINTKLDELSKLQLISVIKWTLRDLKSAKDNSKLNEHARNWCAMLDEAVEYQINKAFNSLVKQEEQ